MTLIFLDEAEATSARLPLVRPSVSPKFQHLKGQTENIVALLENWYDSALFFLDQAEYLRQHDMRTVQTIAILLGLYKNMGDFSLHSTHLASALRIAQTLHLDRDSYHTSSSHIDTQVRRRVWWTLVICEWLQRPTGLSYVRQADFDVALPEELDDEELIWRSIDSKAQNLAAPRPRPVQYHLAMIAIAKVWHRFRTALAQVRRNPERLEPLVLQTDEALANVISELPQHLQEDDGASASDNRHPWIPWQRNSLSMSILYYRMTINRVLQDQWVQSPNSHARTQAICLGSAQAIVSLVDRYTALSARNRPWAIASNLFSAAITLAVEAKFSEPETAAAYNRDVNKCIMFLSVIQDRNMVAARAIGLLESCLSTPLQPLDLPYA